MRSSLILLVSVVACVAHPDSAQELSLLSECPDEELGCVEMEIRAPDLASILISRGPEDASGYSEFRVQVPDGSSSDSLEVVVSGYTGGMYCTSLGQASVAVAGFSNEREPIVFTSTGTLVLEGDALVVGCPSCAELATRDGSVRMPAGVAPAFDFTLVGVRFLSLAYDDAGTLLVSQNGRCLEIPIVGLVRATNLTNCEPGNRLLTPVPGFSLSNAEHLIDVPGREHLLLLRSGACT